jgi:hypothetical protein
MPGLAAPAAAFLVLLDDEDSFLSEQDDVFIAELVRLPNSCSSSLLGG